MAAITWTDVLAAAPELSAVATLARTDILAYVNAALDVSLFGGEAGAMTRLMRIYLAAHFGAMTIRAGAGGQVISESVGGISAAYATVPGAAELALTSYGQLYSGLVRASPARAGLVV